MQESKYKLVDLSEVEKNEFMKKFNDFLNENSVYFEPVPQFTRKTLQSPWEIVTQIFLQKKVEVVEVEKDAVKSPFVENETNPEA